MRWRWRLSATSSMAQPVPLSFSPRNAWLTTIDAPLYPRAAVRGGGVSVRATWPAWARRSAAPASGPGRLPSRRRDHAA